jgi:hypothetical protein
MGVDGHRHAVATLTPGKKPGTHCRESRVGPRAGLDGCGNLAPTEIRFRTVQPVQSCYTD